MTETADYVRGYEDGMAHARRAYAKELEAFKAEAVALRAAVVAKHEEMKTWFADWQRELVEVRRAHGVEAPPTLDSTKH
jgi:hypothetical protein